MERQEAEHSAINVTIIKPACVKPIRQTLQDAIQRSDAPELMESISNKQNTWEMRMLSKRIEAIRQIFELTADRIGVLTNIEEVQLKRAPRRIDDPAFDMTDGELYRQDIITLPEPSYGQILKMRKIARATTQVLFVTYPHDDRMIDYNLDLQDLRSKNNNRNRVFFAHTANEEQIIEQCEKMFTQMVN